jgi:hypothetical protein
MRDELESIGFFQWAVAGDNPCQSTWPDVR